MSANRVLDHDEPAPNRAAIATQPELEDVYAHQPKEPLAAPPGIPLPEFPLLSAREHLETSPSAIPSSTAEKLTKKIVPIVPRVPDNQNMTATSEDATVNPPDTKSILSKEAADSIGQTKPSEGSQIKDELNGTSKDTKQEPIAKQSVKKKAAQSSQGRPAPSKSSASGPTEPAPKASKVASVAGKSTTAKTDSPAPPSSPSRPPSPSTTVAAVRQPRTLRLVQSVDGDAASAPLASTVASRQASGDRGSAQPSTPVRDSEAPSATSNPVSRSTTPPPTKTKGKLQTKKETDSKHISGVDTAVTQPKPKQTATEVVQAPIVGRKKKTKKAKTTAAPQMTVESSPPSPVAVDTSAPTIVEDEPPSSLPEPSPTLPAGESDDSDLIPPIERLPSAASIFSALLKSSELDKNTNSLFLDPPRLHFNLDTASRPDKKPHTKLDVNLTPEQIAKLEANKPVSVRVDSHETVVVLPNHAVLRHLTSEEAKAYEASWQSILEGDEAFLSSTLLPAIYTMDTAWKDCMSTPMAPTGYVMTEQLGHRHIAEQLSMSALGGGHETGFYRSAAEVYQGPGFDPTALATQMEDMSLEDAEQALKTSEDMLNRARKTMEAEEKKLQALVKKNRKALKE